MLRSHPADANEAIRGSPHPPHDPREKNRVSGGGGGAGSGSRGMKPRPSRVRSTPAFCALPWALGETRIRLSFLLFRSMPSLLRSRCFHRVPSSVLSGAPGLSASPLPWLFVIMRKEEERKRGVYLVRSFLPLSSYSAMFAFEA